MAFYFPAKEESPELIETLLLLKRETLLILEGIRKDDKSKFEEAKKVREKMISEREILLFVGPESWEIKLEKQHQEMSNIITQNSGSEAERLTIFQYFSKEETIKKQFQRNGESG